MSENKNPPQNGEIDQLVPGHDYDGIQEFNNPAPFWWQLFFYISIVFAVGYVVYYQFLGGPTLDQELATRLQDIEILQKQNASKGPTEDVFLAAVGDQQKLELGKKVYIEKCAACHLADGGGLVGPNLADKYWIHGRGETMAIYNVINVGIGDKGMPAWGPLMSNDEMIGVVAYVMNLKGQPVAVAKEPQGELVE